MEFLGKLFGRFKEHPHPSPKVTPIPSTNSEVPIKQYPDVTPVTAELLEELVHTDPSNELPRKFVRQGEKVLLASYGEHARIAKTGDMQAPDDAGIITRDKHIERLIVGGDSLSLRINRGNPNRPETIEVLKKIAPGIEILDESDPELYQELYRKK